jgi:Divergent InlB B-repeat domain
VLRFVVAIGAAGLIAAGAASAGGARGDAKLGCPFGQSDRVCLIKQVLGVSPGKKGGAKNKQLQRGSTVDVRGGGVATVVFARDAKCHILARGKRTTILTRRPNEDFLFTQRRGETLCTMSTLSPTKKRIRIKKGQSARVRTTSAAAETTFGADLQVSGAQDEPVQFRLRFRPKSFVGIAVNRGGLIVRFSDGEVHGVGQGQELTGQLTRRSTLKPGSVDTDDAHFDQTENGFFAKEDGSWRRLSVERAGSGFGTVVSNPVGIDCGDDCEERYASGTSVTLTAKASSQSVFTGWSEGCTGKSPRCTVKMDTARFVTAVFESNPGTVNKEGVTVNKEGGGSGTVTSNPAGIDCGSRCDARYDVGTRITLAAKPATGSSFAGWSGDCSGTGSCSLTLDRARSVMARFVQASAQMVHLQVERKGSGSGKVTSDPSGIDCGAICDAEYEAGRLVAVAAIPAAGSRFAGWSSGPCATTENPCWVHLDSATSLTAVFIRQYVLTVDISDGWGSVTSGDGAIDCEPDCSHTYDAGTPVTLTAWPGGGVNFDSLSGWNFDGWGGACAGFANPCILTMDADKSVSASFSVGA